MKKAWNYPIEIRGETEDNYFGHQIKDPYRWLEDPDSKETIDWIERQNKITNEFINSCQFREKIKQRLSDTYNYPKYSCPIKRGSKYYFRKNDGLQNQYVVYSQDNLDAEPVIFFDPNKLSEDGTVFLRSSSFSKSGQFFAYGLSENGSDWMKVYIKDVLTGKDFEDKLEWVKFTGFSWTHDNKGFFYCRYPKPETDKAGTEVEQNINKMIYYHKIGTAQANDILVYHDPNNPKLGFYKEVTDDGKYLLIYPVDGCKREHKVYYMDLDNFITNPQNINIIKLIDNEEAKYDYITNNGDSFYFVTNKDAPKNKIVLINLEYCDEDNWINLIKESDDILKSASCANDKFIVLNYMHDVKDVLKLHLLKDGSFVRNLPTQNFGTIAVNCRREDNELFYKYTSFLNPGTIYYYSFEDNATTVFREIKVNGFNRSKYTIQQVFYPSEDGIKIPMFMIMKNGLKRDGNEAFYLYGYGGFNVSLSPFFSTMKLVLLDNLGVNLAIANLRGGGEYGKRWHEAGMKENKQTVFDDFQAAAEYLIEEKYTNPDKLIIEGGSNGGLMVAACMNQRPDLFKCVICNVGVLDMLRFHKFTIGHAWISDFGNPDNEEDFEYIIKYSPLHNIFGGGNSYPAILVTTADHDDRVVPLHSFKFISTLQYELGDKEFQTEPLMIRIETKAGHGAGKPTSKIIEEKTDVYAFISNVLGLEWNE